MAEKNLAVVTEIVRRLDKIRAYAGDMNRTEFLGDAKTVEACVFNLLQIGELAGRLDGGFRTANPDIPWQKIRGLRNRIVHGYEGVTPTAGLFGR